jgi:hypothetical protein
MFEILFFPSPERYYKENCQNKSDNFGNKIERKNRSERILNDIYEIIKPILLPDAMRELPSIQRPEKGFGLRQHAILNNVKKSSSGYKEHACIFTTPVKKKTNKKEHKTKNSCMGNNPSIGKRISKNDSANKLIDNIRQNGSKSHIPVSNANIRTKIFENEKYPDRNSNMSNKKHDFINRFY